MPRRTLPEPRSWLNARIRHQFGRTGPTDDDWRTPRRASDRALIAAARSQHEFVTHVRQAIRANSHVTTDQLATELDISIDQLRRVLRGESHLLIADLHQLAARLDLRVYTGVITPRPRGPGPTANRPDEPQAR